MRPEPPAEGARWIRQARQDLSDAEYARQGGRHHLACFLCQQAAEKALKGFLYWRGLEAPWGHSAAELCDAARTFDEAFAAVKSAAAALDKYYIATRYPNGLPGGVPFEAFGPEDSERALADGSRVVDLAAQKTEVPPGLGG